MRCRLLVALNGLVLLGACAANVTGTEQPHLVRHDDDDGGVMVPVATGVPPSPEQLVLVGMNAQRLDDLLGPPELALSAGEAQWWRYPLGACTLDVFMLQDSSTPDMIVSHVSVRPIQQAAAFNRSGCHELDARLSQTNAGSKPLPAMRIY